MLFERVSGLRDGVLVLETKAFLRRESEALAQALARIAVIDERRLYAPAGYPSMFEFCVRELGLSESAALHRLNAARIARAHPVLFDAIADRRITLSMVLMLAEPLRMADADELVAGVANKTRAQAQEWLAARFPKPELPTRVEIVTNDGTRRVADMGTTVALFDSRATGQVAPVRPVPSDSREPNEETGPLRERARVSPCSEDRVAYQFTVDRATHELYLRAQELLGMEVAPGDVAAVFAQALAALVKQREKARHGLHTKQRRVVATSANARHIPAAMRAEVHERDGGQCAFTTDDGKRCECRRNLEYDHVIPLAQGGRTNVDNLRLLCRTHNQYEAERHFGRAFMERQRRKPLVNHELLAPRGHTHTADVQAALRSLGFGKAEVASGVAIAAQLPGGASAEECVRAALRGLGRA